MQGIPLCGCSPTDSSSLALLILSANPNPNPNPTGPHPCTGSSYQHQHEINDSNFPDKRIALLMLFSDRLFHVFVDQVQNVCVDLMWRKNLSFIQSNLAAAPRDLCLQPFSESPCKAVTRVHITLTSYVLKVVFTFTLDFARTELRVQSHDENHQTARNRKICEGGKKNYAKYAASSVWQGGCGTIVSAR